MYSLLISLGVALVLYGVVAVTLSPWAAILPAVLVGPIVLFLLARRAAAEVQVALAPLAELAQAGKIDAVRALLIETKQRWGKWQLLLERQLDGQLGMLEYAQTHFDDALPLLERSWRDWSTKVAAGCVHHRRGRLDEAWKAFEEAASFAPKEVSVYLVWATLRSRQGDRDATLAVLSRGLEALPDNGLLRNAKNRVANKQKLETEPFQQTWFQFFPEELMRLASMRGARPGSLPEMPVRMEQRMGPPPPRLRGKLARKR